MKSSISYKGKHAIRSALVTGASGFVGRHLIRRLLLEGIRVNALDNFSNSDARTLGSLAKSARWYKADVRDAAAVRRAVRGVDVVYHLAAIRSVVKSVEDPILAHDVNATGSLITLEESARAGVKQFLFTSTSAVYGENGRSLQNESGPFCPVSPYGIAKLVSEAYAAHYARFRGLNTISFRIFNVYGPQQNPESKYSLVVPGVLSRILAGKAPRIDGTGRQQRDFVYIDDVISALWLATGRNDLSGRVFNIGSGNRTAIKDLVGTLIRLTSKRIRPEHGPRRPGDPDSTRADVRALRRLGWRPKIDLQEGLRRTVQSYRETISA